jgi:polyphosphate kinase
MKNINQVLKSNIEEFDEWYEANTGFESKPRLERIKQFLTQSNQNLISAFKEMVEELPDAEIKITHWGEEMKVKIKAKFTEDILSSLTEEIRHGAGSNCNIDMCPECEKSDNSFSN